MKNLERKENRTKIKIYCIERKRESESERERDKRISRVCKYIIRTLFPRVTVVAFPLGKIPKANRITLITHPSQQRPIITRTSMQMNTSFYQHCFYAACFVIQTRYIVTVVTKKNISAFLATRNQTIIFFKGGISEDAKFMNIFVSILIIYLQKRWNIGFIRVRRNI